GSLARAPLPIGALCTPALEMVVVSEMGRHRLRSVPLQSAGMSDSRAFLRHTLATLAYRGGKSVRGAPPEFASFKASPTSRTPAQILAHIGDLLEWMLSIAKGKQAWNNSEPRAWDDEIARFYRALGDVDAYLASNEPLRDTPEKLFQGPIADALTHVGQIAMLRRIAGTPMKAENYHKADIAAGRLGAEQTAPKREFD